jgi:hypothetical protein
MLHILQLAPMQYSGAYNRPQNDVNFTASTRDESQSFEDQRSYASGSSIRRLSDEHCTSSATIPIYCFDFCRRMSQRLFARRMVLFPLKSERRNLMLCVPVTTVYAFQRAFRELRSCRSRKRMCCRSKGTYSISKQVLVRVSNIYTHYQDTDSQFRLWRQDWLSFRTQL